MAGGGGTPGRHRGSTVDMVMLDAEKLEFIAHNIASTARVKCSNDGCGTYLWYTEVHGRELVCPQGAYTCIEHNCDFTGSPVVLVVHLTSDHLKEVHKFSYGMTKLLQVQMPMVGSLCRRLIGEGEDGTVFVLTINAIGPVALVSAVCVRSASYIWPVYTARMCANALLSSSGIIQLIAGVSSIAKPGAVVNEELTLFLGVPPMYLVGATPTKHLPLYICIDKMSRP
ncbi:hypothetical protein ACQ4PT_054663 [Festuca glaucescens]